jgi:hypothetical protein
MFKITALAALLSVAAPASLAIAAPARTYGRPSVVAPARAARSYARFDHRLSIERSWRDDRGRDDFGPRHYRPTWVPLSASLALGRFGRGAIEVNDPNTFTQLRVQTSSGIARIDRVIVQFADGTAQVAELDRVLDDRNELLEIALDGNNRRIDRIVVAGDGAHCGALQVYGI